MNILRKIWELDDKSKTKAVRDIRYRLQSKTPDELLTMWENNDTEQYSEEAFEAIKQLMIERGIQLPKQKERKEYQSGSLKNDFIDASFKAKVLGYILIFWSILVFMAFITNVVSSCLILQEATNSAETGYHLGAIIGLFVLLATGWALCSHGTSMVKRVSLHEILEKLKSTDVDDKKFALKRLKRFSGKIDNKDFLWSLILMLSHKNQWVAQNSMDALHSLTDEVSLNTKEQWVTWWESKYIKE